MDRNKIRRRKQFSSCDACRQSRVGCDAAQGHGSTNNATLFSCTRCASRNKLCTFEWMKKASNNRPVVSPHRDNRSSPREAFSPMSYANPPVITSSRSPTPNTLAWRIGEDTTYRDWSGHPTPPTPVPAVSTAVADWLQTIYEDVFEAVFGSWLGNYSCPFVFGGQGNLENNPSEQSPLLLSVSISSLCRQFDQWMEDLESQSEQSIPSNRTRTQAELEKEWQIDNSLNRAIQTFSARWLPLIFQSPSPRASQTELIEGLWRGLRQDLLKIINWPCYRSMLSLFLFAMVPIPAGISREEEESGIPAQFCVQAALQHIQQLRARQRSLEFNGSKVSPIPDRVAVISGPKDLRADFMGVESIIYWAALTYDTSASLTFNAKSLLSSGLLGWESESSWRLVKTCTDIFHEQTEGWRLHGVIITEENANQIIAAAAAWKLHVWKVAAVLKEALREGHEEDAVNRAYINAMDAIKQFNVTYRSLLEACKRRMEFLCQHTKLRWYELMLHYHLSILIMIDATETARRTDLWQQLSITRSEAQGSIMDCLVFGLNNQFTIHQLQSETRDTTVTVPLIAIDPYPHHVVAAVQLLWKAVERDNGAGKLDLSAVENLQSILLRTLELLPQSSKSVRHAREQAQLSSVLQKSV